MDFTTMETRVFDLVRDPGKVFVTSVMVKSWLNEAYLDIASRLRLVRDQTTGNTLAGNVIALPTSKEVLEIVSLRLATVDVAFVDDDTWNSWSDSAESPPTTLGRVFNGNIELYPTPTTGTAYVLRYVESPPELVAGADVPDLPTYLHWKLVHYARYLALLKDGDSDATNHLAKYELGLPDPPTGIVKIQPPPYGVSFAAGPFDVADAAHI